jgi:hypothetical protein
MLSQTARSSNGCCAIRQHDDRDGANGVCNRYHNVNQQLCRLLLVVCNTVHDAAIDCRHAGRPARQRHGSGRRDLGDPGFIRYTGPRLRILNRPGVERSVHACYFGVKKEYDRLLPLIAKSLHQLDTLRQPHATTEPRRSRLVLADLGQQVVQESVPDDPLFDCFTHGLLAA